MLDDDDSLVSSLNHVGAMGTFDDTIDDTTLGSDYHPAEQDRDNVNRENSLLSQGDDEVSEFEMDPENLLAATAATAPSAAVMNALAEALTASTMSGSKGAPKAASQSRGLSGAPLATPEKASPEKAITKRRCRLVPILTTL